MSDYYILDKDHNPVPVELLVWAEAMESSDRFVRQDTVNDVCISTVFLGLDHSFNEDGPPVVFETMVFKDPTSFVDDYMERYCTWDEAVAGHERAMKMVVQELEEKE